MNESSAWRYLWNSFLNFDGVVDGTKCNAVAMGVAMLSRNQRINQATKDSMYTKVFQGIVDGRTREPANFCKEMYEACT